MRICPKCGAIYANDSSAFCLVEGTPLIAVDPGTPKWSEGNRVVEEQEKALQLRKRRLKWRRVLVSTTILLVAALFVYGAFSLETTPVDNTNANVRLADNVNTNSNVYVDAHSNTNVQVNSGSNTNVRVDDNANLNSNTHVSANSNANVNTNVDVHANHNVNVNANIDVHANHNVNVNANIDVHANPNINVNANGDAKCTDADKGRAIQAIKDKFVGFSLENSAFDRCTPTLVVVTCKWKERSLALPTKVKCEKSGRHWLCF